MMLKINSFNFGYRFIVYVRVVAVRCGTLLQPMLVKDLSTSSSIGRSLVLMLCYRSCIIILLNCHRDPPVYRLYVKKQKKTNVGCLCQTNNKHIFGVGKGKWRGGEDFSSLDKKSVNL
jgi:hypothetical protein